METKVLNYRIIIEPEKYPDGSTVYVAYCPTLAISDYGDSIEEVLKSIKDGIELAINNLTLTPRPQLRRIFVDYGQFRPSSTLG